MRFAIELRAVDKFFGHHHVLRQLDLQVPERSVFAFLGNNGHGKSTTIRLIAGLANADAGSVQVLGRDIRLERQQVLADMGCLIEAPSAYPNLTAHEFLPIATRLKRLPASEIDRVLEVVALQVDRRQRIEHFSLGMKQRLALAFALVGKPRLLVLDEPTNGLDPDGMQDIRRLLSTLPERADCTIFFSSHLLDEVEKTATHMAVLRSGSVRLQASIRDLTRALPSVLSLDVDAPARAAGVLQAGGHAATVDGAGRVAIADVTRDTAGQIHRTLVDAGVTLFESVHRKPSLEQWFLETAGVEGDAP
ncbi:ATP-binding cassette domain-containing protein [Luteimonas fraxinea]|uniref:ATP-binding cassette domain-containing protein n=1 Tax=Luteimonas fraxinea TaxID=2901869 RepID=UPI001E34E74B|nr:ATP-binding cassette domain-containing protein [Luteimonas fraxinea]MCD9126141.1 ATP-binding cassette domain-containing protein [Luteimonas fraxinea]